MYEECLDSCPLCGNRDVRVAVLAKDGGGYLYNVECQSCGCATGVYEKSQLAVNSWNSRFDEMQYALKPCPLCGGYAEIGHYGYCGEEIDTDLYAVRCSKCHFSTPNTSEDSLDFVIDIWNRMA